MDCVFCRIIKKEIPAEFVYEGEEIVVFKDIEPIAPIHFLIVPKKHIPSVDHLSGNDKILIGELILVAQELARKYKVDKNGYRLVFNVGKDAGGSVEHLHLHLLGGRKLSWV